MTIMTCPACKPDEPCSACLAEELARRNQEHSFLKLHDAYNQLPTAKMIAHVLARRPRGRPSKPKDELLVSLHVSVHPGFLDCLPAKGRGVAIEQAFGFTRPATGRKP